VSRRSAPLGSISLPQDQCFPAHRSLSSQWSRSLVTAFPSPATAAPSRKLPFQGQWSRPATSRPPSSIPRPVRLRLPCLHWFAPVEGSFFASARCASSRRFARLLPLSPLPSRTVTSLGIEAFNRFRRFAAHLPNPPDFLSLPAAVLFLGWLRINVPGSLRFRRFAVPQTSWNLLHYAPKSFFRQRLSAALGHLFLNIYLVYF
jgi:hypothetical protein